jgi:hypothetical protein
MPAVGGGNLGFYRNGGGFTGYNMVLTYDGKVGIGTTNPPHILTPFSNITLPTLTLAAIWPCQLSVAGNPAAELLLKIGSYYTANVGSYCAIQSTETYSGVEHVQPLALQPIGGNVGIGTTSPAALLQLGTNSIAPLYNPTLIVNNYLGGEIMHIYNNLPSNFNFIRLTSSTTVASGSNLFYMSFSNNFIQIGSIVGNGNGTVAYNTNSDARLKKNINYNFDGLSIIDQLKPACFTMISDSSDTVYHGFIAQDIAPIYPQYVTTPAEGIETGYYSMDYSQFTGIAVRAIKQQQTHITLQDNEISLLKQQLASQQSQIDTLIQRLAAANIA